MGRQLLEQGEMVPCVVLLDSMPPGPKQKASLSKRLGIHWENLQASESPGEWFGYLAGRSKRLLLWSLRFRMLRWLVERTHLPLADKNTASRVAVAMYTPAPYPGKVVLFKVRQRPEYVTWDPTAGWENYIQGKFEIREVGGNHTNLLKEPHVLELAQQLRECLEGE
jgi:thioesterase domain-containing protein